MTIMKKKWVWLFLILALVLSACALQSSSDEGFRFEESGADFAPPAEPSAGESDGFADDALGAAEFEIANQAIEAQVRLIIRTGRLELVVSSAEESLDAISDLANSSGGWVVESGVQQFGDYKQGNITIRVPAGEFNAAMNTIKALALEVNSESTSGQDVTEDYVDLSARLANLEATAERVRAFLDETRNVEEALQVNAELSRLESDIEVLKGRIQFLEQSAAFSTISVTLTPDTLSQPIELAGWRPAGVARDAIEALISALQGLATVLIWLVIVALPLGLIFIVPPAGVVWWLRRRRSGRVQSAAQEPPANESG